ncbi:MAG: DUF512 domain-containing protein, partial [Chloroflexi bacterium]|nr:DUF512 domain-containing protein [Chloroflexota bacterium]
WEKEKEEIGDWKLKTGHQSPISNFQSLTLVTGTMFAPVLREATAVFNQITNLNATVLPINNEQLGPTIAAAGLLMGRDALQQLHAADYGDLVILPRIMFDHPNTITLDDISPQAIADQLQRPIALADTMGDVWDAVTGQSRIIYRPMEATK